MEESERARLLAECAQAQKNYEWSKQRRKDAFIAAMRTPISAREISEVTGLPRTTISGIVNR